MTELFEGELPGSREVVEWDWIYLGNHGKVLHAPKKWDDPHYNAYDETAETVCGLTGWGSIPGLFSRGSTPRCSRCCRKVNFPPGLGSPKNDDYCRPLVETRLDRLRQGLRCL